MALFTPHKNPAAAIETNIRHYKRYSISRAYRGESFYWGLVPQAGDFITMTLTPPVYLSSFKFVSGNVEHPHDKFVATNVDVLFDRPDKSKFGPVQADNFVTVASFDDNGVAEAKDLDEDAGGLAHAVRIKIRATSSENWVILSEISLTVSSKASSSWSSSSSVICVCQQVWYTVDSSPHYSSHEKEEFRWVWWGQHKGSTLIRLLYRGTKSAVQKSTKVLLIHPRCLSSREVKSTGHRKKERIYVPSNLWSSSIFYISLMGDFHKSKVHFELSSGQWRRQDEPQSKQRGRGKPHFVTPDSSQKSAFVCEMKLPLVYINFVMKSFCTSFQKAYILEQVILVLLSIWPSFWKGNLCLFHSICFICNMHALLSFHVRSLSFLNCVDNLILIFFQLGIKN